VVTLYAESVLTPWHIKICPTTHSHCKKRAVVGNDRERLECSCLPLIWKAILTTLSNTLWR
jgi:hypothetical protein